MNSEDASLKLDRFLNDAFLDGRMRVKVIHGKGNGILRRMVTEKLAVHPLVLSFRLAGYGEGDGGVTIVELAMK